jgi:hypothetical protein
MPASARSRCPSTSADSGAYGRAAMLMWPRLDRRNLERCGGDPRLIAAYVARRTCLSTDVIVAMLEGHMSVMGEPSFYFG